MRALPARRRSLTARQRQLLPLLVAGMTIGEMAKATGRKRSSVEQGLARARRTLGARNMVHFTAIVVARGLVDVDKLKLWKSCPQIAEPKS